MLKRFNPEALTFYPVGEGGSAECLIPIHETCKIDLEVRCDKEVTVSFVTKDGEFVPLEIGPIVRWSGKVENIAAVEIVASVGFWYRCQRSGSWYEFVDPTPMKVELVHTQADVIKVMIEERLRQYTLQQELNRDLTEDEKDELILDIARGDLDFEEEPDQFGLGYEERLAEFHARAAEASEASSEEEAETPTEPAEKPASGAGNSSPT